MQFCGNDQFRGMYASVWTTQSMSSVQNYCDRTQKIGKGGLLSQIQIPLLITPMATTGIRLDTWYQRKKSSRLDFCYLKFPSRGPRSHLLSSGRAAGGSAKSCICCILCYRYRSKRVNVQGALSCQSLNCLQTTCNSTYFVRAAAGCRRSKKKKCGMHPEFLQHLAAVVGVQR